MTTSGSITAPDPLPEAAVPHPEEMRWAVDLRIGDRVSFQARARATPAGMLAVAVLVAASVVPLAWLAGRRMRG